MVMEEIFLRYSPKMKCIMSISSCEDKSSDLKWIFKFIFWSVRENKLFNLIKFGFFAYIICSCIPMMMLDKGSMLLFLASWK